MTHLFNSDLLLGEADRREADARFPDIAFALDHPKLRETFAPVDREANQSKSRSRRWGVMAVFLAALALMIAAAETLFYKSLPSDALRLIAGVAGLAGVASVAIGVFGVMFTERKTHWLSNRLSTERIRQFHFQFMIAHAEEIMAAAGNPARIEAYRAKRDAAFETFRTTWIDDTRRQLHHIVHAEDPGEGELFPGRAPAPADGPAFRQFVEAYDTLRLRPQLSYCGLILREKAKDWRSAPVKQARAFGRIAMTCVGLIFVLHMLVVVGAIAEIKWMKSPPVHVAAVLAAILALAVRTLEEGLQPETEIERMRQYKLTIQRIETHFRAAETPAAHIASMQDLERLSFHEMTLFLKTNFEAAFVM